MRKPNAIEKRALRVSTTAPAELVSKLDSIGITRAEALERGCILIIEEHRKKAEAQV